MQKRIKVVFNFHYIRGMSGDGQASADSAEAIHTQYISSYQSFWLTPPMPAISSWSLSFSLITSSTWTRNLFTSSCGEQTKRCKDFLIQGCKIRSFNLETAKQKQKRNLLLYYHLCQGLKISLARQNLWQQLQLGAPFLQGPVRKREWVSQLSLGLIQVFQ